jgi:hypothetical protein
MGLNKSDDTIPRELGEEINKIIKSLNEASPKVFSPIIEISPFLNYFNLLYIHFSYLLDVFLNYRQRISIETLEDLIVKVDIHFIGKFREIEYFLTQIKSSLYTGYQVVTEFHTLVLDEFHFYVFTIMKEKIQFLLRLEEPKFALNEIDTLCNMVKCCFSSPFLFHNLKTIEPLGIYHQVVRDYQKYINKMIQKDDIIMSAHGLALKIALSGSLIAEGFRTQTPREINEALLQLRIIQRFLSTEGFEPLDQLPKIIEINESTPTLAQIIEHLNRKPELLKKTLKVDNICWLSCLIDYFPSPNEIIRFEESIQLYIGTNIPADLRGIEKLIKSSHEKEKIDDYILKVQNWIYQEATEIIWAGLADSFKFPIEKIRRISRIISGELEGIDDITWMMITAQICKWVTQGLRLEDIPNSATIIFKIIKDRHKISLG